ncbi:MAG: hypothetical protein DRI90_20720 [Deltaproteobacteria bacterium]|nr:MAG: hypothetical protein DRI90_20720 [Deltaproteobacteria bacterium]
MLQSSRIQRWLRWGRRKPFDALAGVLVLAACGYVIIGPLVVARYPMMTDLPFHAANASILRNYWNESWHFGEQFVLQPFAVPYMSMYVIAAALMVVMPAVTAVKVAAAIMLALLPAGLAVMFWGMRKSPLLGVVGLGFVWCGLTGWGFLNFMGALGLFAMVVGLALRQLDRPSTVVGGLLSGLLILLFFTHPFRFPFALAAVVASAVVLYPATRRWRPVLVPLLPPVVLFAIWWWLRPPALAGEMGPLQLHLDRMDQVGRLLYRSLRDPAEQVAATWAWDVLKVTALGLAALFAVQGRLSGRRRRDWAWGAGVIVVTLGCAGVFLVLYLVLPMQIGLWWYVYPREITSAAFVGLGLLPDLPRQGVLRVAIVAALCWMVVPLGSVVIDNYRKFDDVTRDFTAIADQVPQAPKLCYLIFDHSGSTAINTPFIHLPAYVQADRGGWLSFHFATWGASPIVYRSPGEPGAVVPPKTPLRWEWTPHKFRVKKHGRFFDWFLVRHRRNPSRYFRADPTIELAAQQGTWWLYRRVPQRR